MKIINHPNEFKGGTRILMLTLRGKDGGKNTKGDRVAKKIITDSPEAFDEALQKLISQASSDERIYSTVDARNWDKAIRNFKRLQLENDYAGPEARYGFYRDAFNRVVSSLQQPTARASSLFLWDVDNASDYDDFFRDLLTAGMDNIVHHYETKNGYHVITKPFEYPKLLDTKWHSLLQKNAMMLWAY